MILKHSRLLGPDFIFRPDFKLHPPVNRLDPTTGEYRYGRQTVVQGEDFEYAGKFNKGEPWTPNVAFIRDELEKQYKVKVNCVLIGLYENGEKGITYHKDVMGDDGLIFNVSFGAPRLFRFRYDDQSKGVEHIILQNGEYAVFDAEMNAIGEHDVPPVSQSSPQERWSLTFRTTTHK